MECRWNDGNHYDGNIQKTVPDSIGVAWCYVDCPNFGLMFQRVFYDYFLKRKTFHPAKRHYVPLKLKEWRKITVISRAAFFAALLIII